jgi:hypothetical protein
MNADRAAMNSAIRGGLRMGVALFAVCGEPGSGMFTTKSVPRGIRTLVATVKVSADPPHPRETARNP